MAAFPTVISVNDSSVFDGVGGFLVYATGSTTSLAAAGDFNSDGFDDFILGSPNTSPNGAANIFYGQADGFSGSEFAYQRDGDDGFNLTGANSSDLAGSAVDSAGDFNGDGLTDLIIGAMWTDYGASNSGSAYIVFGSATDFPATSSLGAINGTNGIRIDGLVAEEYVGAGVEGVGDFNGDGLDDVIILAPQAGATDRGQVSVVFGSASAASMDLGDLTGANGFNVVGLTNSQMLQATSLGDINDDGRTDIGFFGNSGKGYVVYGAAGGWGATFDLTTLNGTNGFTYDFASEGGTSSHMSDAGDVNGDGIGDLLIGSGTIDNGAFQTGAAYLVYGTSAGFGASFDPSTLDGTNGFKISTVGQSLAVGGFVSSAGDFNGDGFDDIMVSGGSSTYLIFGRATGQPALMDVTLLNGDNGLRINNAYGVVSAAGDLNSDGYGDLLLNGATMTVLFGSANNSGLYADTLTGTAGNDSFNSGHANDVLYGMNGNDTLNGGTGTNSLFGGIGKDVFQGYDEGTSYVDGGKGEDVMTFAEAGFSITVLGRDSIYTVDHSSTLNGTVDRLTSIELIIGTGYDDVFTGSRGVDGFDGGGGDDRLDGYSGDDKIAGGDGDDVLGGGSGIDLLDGGAGDDLLGGGSGKDTLLGGDDDDRIEAGTGNDLITGGLGRDVLSSGAGKDIIYFGAVLDSARANPDWITDLTSLDRIDLSAIDANSTLGGNQAFTLVAAFTNHKGELVVSSNGSVTKIMGDVNGDGVADLVIMVNGDHDDFTNFTL